MIIAIDASRNRSGGARRHLIELLKNIGSNLNPEDRIHVWSFNELLHEIEDHSWLTKHNPKLLEGNILTQIFWQKYVLPSEFKKFGCDIILNTDAGTVSRIVPSVTMSRDMLSYEPGELDRYSVGRAWLRLLLLKYWQNSSLRHATGVVFLTQYASDVIQKSCGRLQNYKIINHGVSEAFRCRPRDKVKQNKFEVVYVSNVDLYKHHWNVVRACAILRGGGFELTLHLIGSVDGPGNDLLADIIKECDPKNQFVVMGGHVSAKFLPKILSDADIFIFASSCENMPNTLMEGMASGLPIACSRRGPMPEILKDAGTYFDPENVNSIVDSLKSHLVSRTLRSDYSQRAYDLALNFSWEKCAKETISFLRDVYEKHGTNRDIR